MLIKIKNKKTLEVSKMGQVFIQELIADKGIINPSQYSFVEVHIDAEKL